MNTIEEVVSIARIPDPSVEGCNARKNELMMHHQRLLPIEASLKQEIEAEVKQIDAAIQTYLGAHEHRNGQGPLPVIDNTVLTWRHERGLRAVGFPKLALINVEHANAAMRIMVNEWGHAELSVPQAVVPCYRDITMALRPNDGSRTLWFTYKGAIPSDVRATISKERPNFDSIHLLVDAPKEGWGISEKRAPKPVRVDPLVLGYRSDTLYLLGQFDPTPVEKYVADEFTTKPALQARQELTTGK